MGLKDKLKGAWRRVSDLEDNSAEAKEQASAGDRIPYKDISKKLKEIMKKNVDVVGKRILIPPYYTIFFSEYDRKGRLEVEDVLCEELKEELYPEMRKINPDQNKREIQVRIETDNSLEDGHFRIEYSMKPPASEPASTARQEQQPAPKAGPENVQDMDLKETVIEQAPTYSPDDQPTIIQTPQDRQAQLKLVVDSGDSQTAMEFAKEKISLGRASQDDVVLESADFSISRAHATIEIRDGQYVLFPAGVNGTHLNGKELELQKEVVISAGDEIKIMNYTIKLVE